jgi:mono/diheme cytochrome c family protein
MRPISQPSRLLALAVLLTILLVPAAGGAIATPQVTPSQGRAALMHHHFDSVIGALDAVIRGDLSQARSEARLVLAMPDPSGLPESGVPHLRALRAQAERVEKAADLERAAAATVSMLAACGDCHRAVGTMPAHPTPPEPKIGGVLGHMEEHKVAADLMAQGLTTPSSSLWMDGAEALTTVPLHRGALPDTAKISHRALQAEANIHALATRARTTSDTDGRVQIYSELIMSCSTCHAANGGAGPLP